MKTETKDLEMETCSGEGVVKASPGYLPTSVIEFKSPVLAGRFFTTEPPGKIVFDLEEHLLSFTILIILNY